VRVRGSGGSVNLVEERVLGEVAARARRRRRAAA
jgi:hypothetical protein